jgi:hypothetical protein
MVLDGGGQPAGGRRGRPALASEASMENRYSPWSTEPDAPGVLILGTPPRTLVGGAATHTAQTLRLAVEAARHDFPHTVRSAIQRARATALAEMELAGSRRA